MGGKTSTVRRVAMGTVALLLAWVLTAFGLDRWGGGDSDDVGQADAIIVLGCRVLADGSPSIALAERVRRAVALHAAGVAPTIVMTGGVGKHGRAEAEVAGALARELGVPADAIVLEARSTSTEENAALAVTVTDARRVVVVTDAYHAWRAERVFARWFADVRTVGTHSPELGPRVRGALREVIAIGVYGVRGRL